MLPKSERSQLAARVIAFAPLAFAGSLVEAAALVGVFISNVAAVPAGAITEVAERVFHSRSLA